MSRIGISGLWGWIILIVIVGCCLSAQGKYGGGSGTPEDPYLIYDANHMQAIGAYANDWDKHFKLMADIDLGGYTGEEFNIIGYLVDVNDKIPFSGVFDGNGHTISNFRYTSTGTSNIGLFGYVDDPNAEIKDVGLIDPNVNAGTGDCVGSLVGRLDYGTITNCYVQGGSVSGHLDVSGLVGYNWDGTIINCYSTGSVSGTGDYVGGLVGDNEYGRIINCYSTGSVSGMGLVGGLAGWNLGDISNSYSGTSVSGNTIVGGLVGWNLGDIGNCYSTGSVSGDYVVGGLVGYNYESTITKCYSTGIVTGAYNVGGLVGLNQKSTITECYSSGSVTGNIYVGGLVGLNQAQVLNSYSTGNVSGVESVGGLMGYNDGTVSASFWDIDTSGEDWSGGGTGLPTEQMQMQITFTDAGWDFNTPVWTIDEGVDYPRLWLEFVPVLHAEPEVTVGTSNIISWEPIPDVNDFYTECAEDANFTSILYNSGWITETSYEFTGLQLDQRYWYSVKARNSAGVESQWSNVESSLQVSLADAVEATLEPESLKNENMKNALLNKIDAVLNMIEEGNYTGALSKLEHDILAKMNGCGETGEPDKNDWIITCEEQNEIYPLVIETIEYVKSLMEERRI